MTNLAESWKANSTPIPTSEQLELFPELNADDMQVSGSHYKDMGIQPWTVMEAILTREEFIGYLKGNVIKYTMRKGRKDGSDDEGKAKHYMKKLIEVRGY